MAPLTMQTLLTPHFPLMPQELYLLLLKTDQLAYLSCPLYPIRDISGSVGLVGVEWFWTVSGPFYSKTVEDHHIYGSHGDASSNEAELGFDVSRVAPTAAEIRPHAISFLPLISY